MNRALRNTFAAGAAILALSGATAMQANATYLGYGNGDPGNWDLWQEQNGGATTTTKPITKPMHHASAHHQHHVVKPGATKPALPHYKYEKS
jgi:hypothetical protein